MIDHVQETTVEVELLLFEVGGQIFGADASQVLRIDRAGASALVVDGLGRPAHGRRALVFQSSEGEEQLAVDFVHGVRAVAADTLRRLPVAIPAPPYTIGIWLDGEKPVLLISLNDTLKAKEGSDADHGS